MLNCLLMVGFELRPLGLGAEIKPPCYDVHICVHLSQIQTKNKYVRNELYKETKQLKNKETKMLKLNNCQKRKPEERMNLLAKEEANY